MTCQLYSTCSLLPGAMKSQRWSDLQSVTGFSRKVCQISKTNIVQDKREGEVKEDGCLLGLLSQQAAQYWAGKMGNNRKKKRKKEQTKKKDTDKRRQTTYIRHLKKVPGWCRWWWRTGAAEWKDVHVHFLVQWRVGQEQHVIQYCIRQLVELTKK